jgi:hypothetical protein
MIAFHTSLAGISTDPQSRLRRKSRMRNEERRKRKEG